MFYIAVLVNPTLANDNVFVQDFNVIRKGIRVEVGSGSSMFGIMGLEDYGNGVNDIEKQERLTKEIYSKDKEAKCLVNEGFMEGPGKKPIPDPCFTTGFSPKSSNDIDFIDNGTAYITDGNTSGGIFVKDQYGKVYELYPKYLEATFRRIKNGNSVVDFKNKVDDLNVAVFSRALLRSKDDVEIVEDDEVSETILYRVNKRVTSISAQASSVLNVVKTERRLGFEPNYSRPHNHPTIQEVWGYNAKLTLPVLNNAGIVYHAFNIPYSLKHLHEMKEVYKKYRTCFAVESICIDKSLRDAQNKFFNKAFDLISQDMEVDAIQEALVKILEDENFPLLLVEEATMKDFKNQIRNVDNARMIFELRLDKADVVTGVGEPNFLYKDIDGSVSVIRPLTINRELIKTVLASLETFNVEVNGSLYRDVANEQRYLGAEKGDTKILYLNIKSSQAAAYGVTFADKQCLNPQNVVNKSEEGLKRRVAKIGTPLPESINLDEFEDINDLPYKNIKFDYNERCVGGYRFIRKVHDRYFFDESYNSKTLETKPEEKKCCSQYENVKGRGISSVLAKVHDTDTLIGYLLKQLDKQIFVLDFKRVNFDTHYSTAGVPDTPTIMGRYLDKTRFIQDLNERRVRDIIAEGYVKIDRRFDIIQPKGTCDYYGGTVDQEYDECIQDGYLRAVEDDTTGKRKTVVGKSLCFYKTTYIDTEKSGIDDHSISYDPTTMLFICKMDNRKVVDSFVNTQHPAVRSTTPSRLNDYSGVLFKYIITPEDRQEPLYFVDVNGVQKLKPVYGNNRGLYRNSYTNGELTSSYKIPEDLYNEYSVFRNELLAEEASEKLRYLIENRRDDIDELMKSRNLILKQKEYEYKLLELDKKTQNTILSIAGDKSKAEQEEMLMALELMQKVIYYNLDKNAKEYSIERMKEETNLKIKALEKAAASKRDGLIYSGCKLLVDIAPKLMKMIPEKG